MTDLGLQRATASRATKWHPNWHRTAGHGRISGGRKRGSQQPKLPATLTIGDGRTWGGSDAHALANRRRSGRRVLNTSTKTGPAPLNNDPVRLTVTPIRWVGQRAATGAEPSSDADCDRNALRRKPPPPDSLILIE